MLPRFMVGMKGLQREGTETLTKGTERGKVWMEKGRSWNSQLRETDTDKDHPAGGLQFICKALVSSSAQGDSTSAMGHPRQERKGGGREREVRNRGRERF